MVTRVGTRKTAQKDKRLMFLKAAFGLATFVVIFRLFSLQIVNASFYQQLASGQHNFYKELFAERGDVYVKDWVDGVEYIAVTNRPVAFVYAEPRKITDPEHAAKTLADIFDYPIPTDTLASEDDQGAVLGLFIDENGEVIPEEVDEVPEIEAPAEPEMDTSEYDALLERLSKEDDPYEPVKRDVDEKTLEKIKKADIEGIRYVLEDGRTYPESGLGGHLFGFLGSNDEGEKIGSYGVEGFFNGFLSGVNGFLDSQTDSSGRWIAVGSRTFEPAVDGGDILLTIDRTIQYKACDALKRGVVRYQADGGSIVIMDPKTGQIIAMCNVPDFDPNTYNQVPNISYYNNRAIFEAYEPGSVFKPLVMAAAIDRHVVSPTTLFNDTGEVKIDRFTIRNSDLKANGWVDMTAVLEDSLNTGMVFVMRQMGGPVMADYLRKFGFGELTGIELNTESPGNMTALEKDSEIYYATASFGQGVTATVLQLAQAYSAIANNGMMMKPYIIEELRYPDGKIEKRVPQEVGQVVSQKTAATVGGMMVSVVEEGHATTAQVPGYYIAGKTGTAQVARTDGPGYQVGVTKATFAGYGPAEDPVFVAVVMLDHPRTSPWADGTATVIFTEVADFILHYFDVPPRRPIE